MSLEFFFHQRVKEGKLIFECGLASCDEGENEGYLVVKNNAYIHDQD